MKTFLGYFRERIFRRAYKKWRADHAPRLGAALAYYTIFSLAPLLIIVISITGIVFGHAAIQGRVMQELQGIMGIETARAVQEILAASSTRRQSLFASIIGTAIVVIGATGVFTELQGALNIIWCVQPQNERGWIMLLKDRWLSFAMVLVIGFLLLVSLILSTATAYAVSLTSHLFPISNFVITTVHLMSSFVLMMLLFAFIFKFLPDATVRWRDVWLGAAVSALLFVIGKFAIGFYLARAAVISTFGAAGSLAAILVWTYYSAQILLYGAEVSWIVTEGGQSKRKR